MNGSTDVVLDKSGNGAASLADWLHKMVSILQEQHVLAPNRDEPVVKFLHPAELKVGSMHFTSKVPDLCMVFALCGITAQPVYSYTNIGNKAIDISVGSEGIDDAKIFKLCQDVVEYSVMTNHPYFHNQLYNGMDPYGLVGSLISEALNTNQYTYEMAPVFCMSEEAILAHFRSLVGFEDGDGIFAPGGSLSNMYGMMLARHQLAPESKKKGIRSLQPLVVFTSQDAHYSCNKGVNWLGIGTDNLIQVPCDSRGRMIPSELEKAIDKVKAAGSLPLCVNATAGTTVFGAFDPINELADVCAKHNVWLHVDACWGGSLIFSEKQKHLFKGINRVDSISWNPHKMLGAPLQCSLFLTSHKGLLHQCNSAAATYLFQQDKFYDVSYDTGDKSLQCGRKVDAFKLWLMWRARGDSGFGLLVDRAMENAEYLRSQLSKTEGFRLVIPEFQCTNICFWFIPKRLRGITETEAWWDEIDKVAPKIKEKLTMAGTLLVSYQPLKHRKLCNFFRMVNACHPPRSHEDMDYVIRQIQINGEDL